MITIPILLNIPGGNGKKLMKFDQVTEYILRNFFDLQTSFCFAKNVFFFFFVKTSSQHYSFNIFS